EDKGVAFVVATNEEGVVKGDRDLLLEAVANLVDNAVKFAPAGGRVELSLSRRGNDAVVIVRDTGPGIAEEEREHVGRRFYRSDKSRREPGLGLGLSLVNAIVKLHGFRFAISSGPGCVAEMAGPAVAGRTATARRLSSCVMPPRGSAPAAPSRRFGFGRSLNGDHLSIPGRSARRPRAHVSVMLRRAISQHSQQRSPNLFRAAPYLLLRLA